MNGMTKVIMTHNIGLMFLDILVNRKSIMTMIDTSVTHNFISIKKVMRLGLTLKKRELYMKAMNS